MSKSIKSKTEDVNLDEIIGKLNKDIYLLIIEQNLDTMLDIVNNYCCDYEAHNLAYKLNDQYKIFYDNLPDKMKNKYKIVRGLGVPSDLYVANVKVLINVYTLGAPILIRKLRKKKTKYQLLKEEVVDKKFMELLKHYNSIVTKSSYNI